MLLFIPTSSASDAVLFSLLLAFNQDTTRSRRRGLSLYRILRLNQKLDRVHRRSATDVLGRGSNQSNQLPSGQADNFQSCLSQKSSFFHFLSSLGDRFAIISFLSFYSFLPFSLFSIFIDRLLQTWNFGVSSIRTSGLEVFTRFHL